MLRFICFGSGSSGNCYFLYTENDGLMIDVGIGVRALKKNLHQYGLKLPQIKHIILTHDHADHVKSVGSLSHELNIPVYSTKLVHEGIMRNYCVRHKIDRQNIKFIEKGSSFTLGDFQIFPKMVGQYHRPNGHEFEQVLGDSEGQESLACCCP